MKKFLLSFIVVSAFAGYVIVQKFREPEEGRVVAPNIATSTNLPTATTFNLNQPTPTATAPTTSSGYKDGSYTGIVTDAFYGPVQVQAIISAGKITDVIFLQYPNDRRTSIEINSQAMPFLKQEAIAAQSSQVDIVSGATQTSRAFIESLKSALDQARI